jgi:hypothetical protein
MATEIITIVTSLCTVFRPELLAHSFTYLPYKDEITHTKFHKTNRKKFIDFGLIACVISKCLYQGHKAAPKDTIHKKVEGYVGPRWPG